MIARIEDDSDNVASNENKSPTDKSFFSSSSKYGSNSSNTFSRSIVLNLSLWNSHKVLRVMESVDNEVNFQIELYELLEKSKREPSLVDKLYKLSLNGGVSNIGLSLE